MSEFEIRHYEPEKDLTAIAQMLTVIESVDRDGEDTSEEYLLASLQWPNYRPNQDVWVAQSHGQLTGYAVALEQPSAQCTIYVVVHPSQRRKGLGSQLLALILKRAREFDSKTILVYANEKNQGANLFLKKYGFSIVGSCGSLKMPATIEVPDPAFPAEYSLKRYSEVNDPRILLYALDICYFDMWGHQHNEQHSPEEFKSPRFLQYYDTDNILLLFDSQDSIIGICSLKPEGKRESNGEVSDLLDGPGIVQALREKNLQRELVLSGIHHLRKKGTRRPITLEFWGDTEDALKSYRELGFKMFNHYITYTRDLA